MGIMCGGTVFPAWQAACLREVLGLGFVEPVLLIVDAAEWAVPRPSPLRRMGRALVDRRTAWNLFQRLFVRGRSRATVPVDLAGELAGVARLPCSAPLCGPWARHFTPEEVEGIRAHRLDFIVRFAFNIVKGDVLSAARLGVWSFHHDDLDRYRGPPACFWPMYFGDPVQGATLQRLTDGIDNGIVLARAWYRTHGHSYVRNRDTTFFASAGLVARVCRELHAGAGAQARGEPARTTAPMRTTPGPLATLTFCLRIAWRKAVSAFRALLRHEVWNVAVVDQPIQSFLDLDEVPRARWLPRPEGAPRGSLLADPFGLSRAGGLTLLCEQADAPEGRGRIVAIDWDGERPGPPRPVLAPPHHLSYPFLLEEGGETYLIPESGEVREIVLFRAVEFPHRWERVGALVAGIAGLDASVFRWEERWWLFAATKGTPERGGAWELFAWHAEDLRGPYTPHLANPVKADVRSTRPAGTPFVHDGRLYRPAQDCSTTYGGAVALCRIDRLGPGEFEESVVRVVRPNRRDGCPDGFHTLSSCGGRTLIDGKRTTLIFRESLRRIGAALRRRGSPKR
jgi:hypothetical protein